MSALARALAEGRPGARAVLVASIDGEDPSASELAPALLAAGFVATSRGFHRRVGP